MSSDSKSYNECKEVSYDPVILIIDSVMNFGCPLSLDTSRNQFN